MTGEPTTNAEGLDFLVSFVSGIRPARGRTSATANLSRETALLAEKPDYLQRLRKAVHSQLVRSDLSAALMESGIPMSRGFWQELFGRLRHKLLPPLQPEDDFLYVLNCVFFRRHDYIWVEEIPRDRWIAFFETLGLSLNIEDSRLLDQLLRALNTLSFQVAQLGLEREVLHYLPFEYQAKNPFVEQSYLVRRLAEDRDYPEGDQLAATAAEINACVARCEDCLDYIRESHSEKGASLHQTYMLLLLANRLERMMILVDLLDKNETFDTGKFVDYFRALIRYENRKNSILEFMSQSMGYLAYQIAEHKGAKGNKYITTSRASYRAMFQSAMGGGAWICLVVLIKNLLIRLPMAVFWRGFAFSVNYSLGFVLIEETHATLATKQPAFTASAVAGTLDTRNNTRKPNLYNLALTVARVSRSQFASFVGNLVVVFPGVWLLGWGYEELFGKKLVSGAAAVRLLKDQHPWESLSLLYAGNTGVFLFLSGIIAGYVQNKIRYSQIGLRLQTHPVLRLSMSSEKRRRLAEYVEGHAGALAGNISLGFFLGMAGFFGEIFGIRFDIRHITIAAGNVSMAVYGLGFQNVPVGYLLTVVAGVLAIGFLNFLVSFSLAFFVAVRSRGIRLRDYPEFLGILGRYFFRRPLDFIRPGRHPVEE
jgi:site-specific recombinase